MTGVGRKEMLTRLSRAPFVIFPDGGGGGSISNNS